MGIYYRIHDRVSDEIQRASFPHGRDLTDNVFHYPAFAPRALIESYADYAPKSVTLDGDTLTPRKANGQAVFLPPEVLWVATYVLGTALPFFPQHNAVANVLRTQVFTAMQVPLVGPRGDDDDEGPPPDQLMVAARAALVGAFVFHAQYDTATNSPANWRTHMRNLHTGLVRKLGSSVPAVMAKAKARELVHAAAWPYIYTQRSR